MNTFALCRCTIALAVLALLAACSGNASSASQSATTPLGIQQKTYQDIVVGFAQIGAESEWRTANTRSIRETATALGVELKLADAQQQQDNQIKAIRSFIAQRVDVIGVSPVVEKGWDAVFTEVKHAGIPLILVDRAAPAAAGTKTYKDMTLCFPQLGAESDWRTANTASMKETASSLGVKQLVFSDAQQKQENQISAVRACIQQGVDVIALPPVVEDGWDAVLTEAKNASIPVIIVDRSVSADKSLYAAHIGSDMELEGQKAAAEFNKLLPNGGAILELSGTTGSGAAVGRAKGLRDKLNPNIKILDSQTGNFTRAEAVPVMQAFLKKYKPGTDFQGVFMHNDDMGIGAIEALKAAGAKPGDIKIVSVDGTRGGFQAMVDGWFQADVECNPLLGPQVFDLALKLMNGQAIKPQVLTDEAVYYPDKAKDLLPTRKY